MSESPASKHILALLRLGEGNAAAHLGGLARSSSVRHVDVMRESAFHVAPADAFTWHVYGRRRLPPLARILSRGVSLVRAREIDVVVSFFLVPYGLLAWAMARLTGRPVVVCLVGSDFNRHLRAWYGGLLRAVLRRCDRVTATGVSMVEELARWGIPSERLHVLPHSIDVDRFSSSVALEDREFDVVFVGSLIPLKRVDDLLRACALARETRPDFRVAVVGDGPERQRLERLAEEIGLLDHVHFAGYQDRPERYFAQARIVTITSEAEGLPFVLVEGMSCGCVPMTTRCGDVTDLVEDGRNGIVVDVGDWKTLGAAMAGVLETPSTLAKFSRQALTVREGYSWSAAADAWSTLLEGLH